MHSGKVLITGSNGMVGRALFESLVRAKREVVAVVRNSQGLANEIALGDITPHTDWRAALAGCSAVVHLAARVHVMHAEVTDTLSVYRAVNTSGTLNLATQAAEAGVRRFIYLSSIKVNGEGQIPPPHGEKIGATSAYTETDIPQPQDAYAISKWEAEQGLLAIAQETGMEVVILRPPLVYGPGVKANFLKLMRAIELGLPLPLGRVRNNRSLLYLGNLVDAITICLTHPAAANKTYVISDGADISTPALIRQMAEALGRPPRLLAVPQSWLRLAGRVLGKEMAIDRLLNSLTVDSSTIRRELGWTPPYSIYDGLVVTAAWFKNVQISHDA